MAHSRDVDVWIWDVGNDIRGMHIEMVQSRMRVNARRFWQPCVDVFETEADFLVKVELAGVRREEIQLIFLAEEHVLRVRGLRHDGDASGAPIGVHQLEIMHGEFERDIRLPRGRVKVAEIQAEMTDGILRVRLPKGN